MTKKIKTKNKKMYFDQEVQDAIVHYNKEENHIIKNKIYEEKIAYAIDKLVENIINTFKISYFDSKFNDIKQEVVSFIVLNMDRYDESKGYKAFSYFSVVAKNYLIFHNNNNYKKMKTHEDSDSKKIKRLKVNNIETEYNRGRYKEFLEQFSIYVENKIDKIFKKQKDKDIAFSILDLISKTEEIDNFYIKAIYILIKEMTGVKTVEITRVLNIMKKQYMKLNREFSNNGSIDFK